MAVLVAVLGDHNKKIITKVTNRVSSLLDC
uniref:Uncharacterized protein n=1 Tax=Arundo donax TaxID=35708 RepID=A0A0A9HQ16_ARUDO